MKSSFANKTSIIFLKRRGRLIASRSISPRKLSSFIINFKQDFEADINTASFDYLRALTLLKVIELLLFKVSRTGFERLANF